MSNYWIEAAKESLLPQSESDDISVALQEWQFTGDVTDCYAEGYKGQCELCQQEDLRWHYKIKNQHNENVLLVGSKCILRFAEIGVIDSDTGKIVSGDERRLILNRERDRLIRKQIREAKEAEELKRQEEIHLERERFLNALRQLWLKAERRRPYVESIGKKFKRGESLAFVDAEIINRLLKTYDIDI